MRKPWLALSVATLSALCVAAPRLFAGDPAPLSADEQAKVTRLIEDLGSVDFRIREAATKGLIGMGERARPALETAAKSDNPAVRFRADQILQGLNGGATEKPVDDGEAKSDPKADPDRRGPNPWGGARADQMREAIEKMMKQFGGSMGQGGFEEQMRELEKRLRDMEEQWKSGGNGMPGVKPFGPFEWPGGAMPGFGPRALRRARDLRAKVDAGTVLAEVSEGPRGARLVLTSKADPSSVATFTGKSVGAILEANPKLREWTGVPEVLGALDEARAKRAAEEKAEAEARKGGSPFGGGVTTTGRSVKIEQSDGRVRVEISETGADGKPVTKTYEGTDLESLKAQHPELKDALGGMSVHFGSGPGGGGMKFPKMPKEFRFGDDDDDDDDIEGMEEGKPATGPFGLGLTPVDDDKRAKLSLPEGTGTEVVAIREGSDAEKLGLKAGDIIVKVNDKPVTSIEEMGRVLRETPKDRPLTIEVLRDGKSVTLNR